MIEEMVAASIVTLSVFAITATSVATFKSYDRQRTITAMVELENKLIGSLNSQEVQLSIRDGLVKGEVKAGTSITVKDLAADGSSTSSLVGIAGSQIFFSRKGHRRTKWIEELHTRANRIPIVSSLPN